MVLLEISSTPFHHVFLDWLALSMQAFFYYRYVLQYKVNPVNKAIHLVDI